MSLRKIFETTPVLRSFYWRLCGHRRARAEQRRWAAMTPQAVFAEIYQTNRWNDSESRSGAGSSLRETETLRAELPALLARHRIESIADTPCGDFNWMARVNLGGISYVGCDIVPALIEKNSATHRAPNLRFAICNLITDPLPKADLLFIRDCLVHLSHLDTALALRNIIASEARFLFTTSFPGVRANRDITTGDWRMINLELPPYNFPPPLETIRENCGESAEAGSKSMCLWNLADLRRLPPMSPAPCA